MESASSMLRLVEPILDRHYPTLHSELRERVICGITYHAGMAEAFKLLVPHLYTPEKRLEVWTEVMHDLVHQVLEEDSLKN